MKPKVAIQLCSTSEWHPARAGPCKTKAGKQKINAKHLYNSLHYTNAISNTCCIFFM